MEPLIFHPWYWLVAGFALIALESLGMGGFLLGGAAAGFVVALVSWLKESLPWTSQLILFAFLALVFTLIYWWFFKRFNQQSDSPLLNDRAAQLCGREFTLHKDLPVSGGRVQIGDTLWKARCSHSMKKGRRVVVSGNTGMVLFIKPVNENSD